MKEEPVKEEYMTQHVELLDYFPIKRAFIWE
jgi:hypothetical protein